MGKRPPNADKGLENANAVRLAQKLAFERRFIDEVFSAAFFCKAKTNEDYADIFNRDGFPTRRGIINAWTRQLVAASMKDVNLSAKGMLTKFEPRGVVRMDWPHSVYVAWSAENNLRSELSERNGSWVRVLDLNTEPHRAMPCRLIVPVDKSIHEETGSIIKSLRGGAVFECSYIRHEPLLTFRIEYAAKDLEVYVFKLSLEQRMAESQWLLDKYFKPELKTRRVVM